jgi:hypothetical protein
MKLYIKMVTGDGYKTLKYFKAWNMKLSGIDINPCLIWNSTPSYIIKTGT